MKNPNIFIFIIVALFFCPTFAQTTVQGKIIDQNNNIIPYVHIKVKNHNIGTIANENGLFKLVLDKGYEYDTIVISALGYKTKMINIKREDNNITLLDDIAALQEVTVVATDKGKELIQKAIKAIPRNYSEIEERHIGFFREVANWKKYPDKPIYITEAVVEAVKQPYYAKHESGNVKLVEYREYKSNLIDSLSYRIFAGTHHIHRFDIVSSREAFLGKPNKYSYKIVDTLKLQNKSVYNIRFSRKNIVSGNVYVQDSTFAIIKADFKYTDFNDFKSLLTIGRNRQYLNFTVTYEQGNDTLWQFKHSKYQTAFKQKHKIFVLSSEYATTKVEPNKAPIKYTEQLQFNEVLLNNARVYNPNFWSNYNIIISNKTYENLFKSVRSTKEPKPLSKYEKRYNILSKIRSDLALTFSTASLTANTLTFTNPVLSISESLNKSRQNVYGLSISFLYEFKPHFFIGYVGESKISKSGITSHDLAFKKQININPKNRSIFITPGINLGYQQIDAHLRNYNTTQTLDLNKKSLRKGKTAVFLSQRNIRFQPNLYFNIEKSKHLNFVFSVNYNIPLSKKEGLLFQEKEGFFLFRKKAFAKNGTENLYFEQEKELLKSNFGFSLGIAIHL